MPFQTGQIVNNRYRIVKLLGQGGFGAVYRAWDMSLNRPCALKENLDTSPEASRQFAREASVLANLIHLNLPRVTDHFSIPGQGQYLVMDFIDGEDLGSLVQRQGPVNAEQALAWISQVADALIYMHHQNPPVIHRDIKPANIRITREGRAVLVDFGLVKFYNPQLRTTMGARAVTPGYSPPEQYGQGVTDTRSDIYALGATLYTLLTGVDPTESIQRMMGQPLPPIRQYNPQIRPSLEQVVERAMALNAAQRYQSVEEFIAALRASVPLFSPAAKETVAPSAADATVIAPAQPYAQTSPMKPAPAPAYPEPSAYPPPAPTPYPSAPAGRSLSRPARKSPWIAVVGISIGLILFGLLFGVGGTAIRHSNQTKTARAVARAEQTQEALDLTETALWQIALDETATANAAQERTATVILQKTAAAKAQTATAIAVEAKGIQAATQTAAARRTSTAQAQAQRTQQIGLTQTASGRGGQVLIFGPKSGTLTHDPTDGLIEDYLVGVNVRDFIVEAVFYNPYSTSVGSWDYGFLLRHAGFNQHFRLVIFSNRSWRLQNNTGSSDGKIINEGKLTNLDTSGDGFNKVKVICAGQDGSLYINDRFIASLDLSARMNSGDVSIGTGFYSGDEISGYSTRYQDFRIWELP